MKTKLTVKHTALALLALSIFTMFYVAQPTTASAQNTVFTYQGRVTDNGTNFTGSGQFEFALLTSTNISRPATATANLSGPFVPSYTVTSGGGGYVTAPAVTVSGGGGSGATAHTVISGGVVTSVIADSAGTGYTSAPTVTIAPPPPTIAYTTYWSNDGTSVDGSEPSAAVSVPVNNGLFLVTLGDTAVANMAAMDAALFAQPDLQLRIWFNDGVNGFAALSPVQNLTPAPYAIYSANAGNALTATTAASADFVSAANIVGTLPVTQLPAAVVTNGASGVNLTGTFGGNGGGLTNLDAANISSGTLPDARLSANVASRAGGNAFTGQQTVTGGNVGIGTTSPQAAVHVRGTDGAQFILQNSTDSSYWYFSDDVNDNLVFAPNTGFGAYIDRAGNYHNNSDVRLKRDITPLNGVLDRVLQLRPVSYHFRAAPEGIPLTFGLIAQEVEPLFPEVVGERAGMKSLAYSELVPVTIGAIQELNQKLEQKETEITELKQRLDKLEQLMNEMNGRPQ